MNTTVPVFNIERFAIHDGMGIRTVVFLQGCRLHCPWCANPESQTIKRKLMFLEKNCAGCGRCVKACPQQAIQIHDSKASINRDRCVACGLCADECIHNAMQISGKFMTLEDIYKTVIRDEAYYQSSKGGITFSGGEALLHAKALLPLLEKLKKEGYSVDFETCGDVPKEHIESIISYVDTFLFDIKSLNKERFESVTGGNLDTILKNITYIASADPNKITIRVPVIPEFNFDATDIEAIFRFALKFGVRHVDLLPYHTLGKTKYLELGLSYPYPVDRPLSKEDLLPFQTRGEALGLTVTIGG